MHCALQIADAFAVDDADFQNSPSPTFVEVIGNEAADLPRFEGVQVQHPVNRKYYGRLIGTVLWQIAHSHDFGGAVLARTMISVERRRDSARSPRRSFCMISMAANPRRNFGWRAVVRGTRKCSLNKMLS